MDAHISSSKKRKREPDISETLKQIPTENIDLSELPDVKKRRSSVLDYVVSIIYTGFFFGVRSISKVLWGDDVSEKSEPSNHVETRGAITPLFLPHCSSFTEDESPPLLSSSPDPAPPLVLSEQVIRNAVCGLMCISLP